jgi:quercetin dioxygenase-like cupin family protein
VNRSLRSTTGPSGCGCSTETLGLAPSIISSDTRRDAQRHRHSAAHTIVVIDGVLQADGRLLRAGSYAHFPAETPMRHEPAPDRDCLFVILFDGPFDVHPVGDDEHDGSQ